jgi:hypothetical protein
MVKETDPIEPDRPRGMSERDRKYLVGDLDVQEHSQRERNIRSDIRDRVWNTLLDLYLFYEYADERDIRSVFGYNRDDTDTQQERYDAITESLRSIFTLVYRYKGDDTPAGFEYLLKSAITRVETAKVFSDDAELLEPANVDIEVTPPRAVDPDEIAEKFVEVVEMRVPDWTVFTRDELLFLLWHSTEADGIGLDDYLPDGADENMSESINAYVLDLWANAGFHRKESLRRCELESDDE